MKMLLVLLLAGFPPLVRADDCVAVKAQLKLPIQLKLGGKPKQARWAQVEKTLTRLREEARGSSCELSFGEVFSAAREDAFFPILHNLLRTAPEESLVGASVFAQNGHLLGKFANRVTFQKQGEYNYTTYYFQFADGEGRLQSGGNPSLIDHYTGRALYLLRWSELAERTLLGEP